MVSGRHLLHLGVGRGHWRALCQPRGANRSGLQSCPMGLRKRWILASSTCRLQEFNFNERSQEVIENKGDRFWARLQSQEVSENKGVIFVKPRGC